VTVDCTKQHLVDAGADARAVFDTPVLVAITYVLGQDLRAVVFNTLVRVSSTPANEVDTSLESRRSPVARNQMKFQKVGGPGSRRVVIQWCDS